MAFSLPPPHKAGDVNRELYQQFGIVIKTVPSFELRSCSDCLRASVHLFNREADYDLLASALTALLKD